MKKVINTWQVCPAGWKPGKKTMKADQQRLVNAQWHAAKGHASNDN